MADAWDEQQKLKYRDHDLSVEDMKEIDFIMIKNRAVSDFVETRENDQAKLIIMSFMGFMTSRGYRIVKKENA